MPHVPVRPPVDPAAELTVAQAAAHLSVTTQTIRRWITSGRLPAHRVGPRLIRVNASDLDQLLTPVTLAAG